MDCSPQFTSAVGVDRAGRTGLDIGRALCSVKDIVCGKMNERIQQLPACTEYGPLVSGGDIALDQMVGEIPAASQVAQVVQDGLSLVI